MARHLESRSAKRWFVSFARLSGCGEKNSCEGVNEWFDYVGVIPAMGALIVAIVSAAPAGAEPEPAPGAPDPFPDIRYYDELDAGSFAQPGGVWFTAPGGQNCGIWGGLGSFGCAGDIPGAPAGVDTSVG